jgi:serine protease Do
MDKAILRTVLVGLLWVLPIPDGRALDSDTERSVRAATFEFFAPISGERSKGLVGTAFAIGPNEFVTAAHLFIDATGSHFGHPVLMDSSQVAYPIADILQLSEPQDYVIFSLERSLHVKPLVVRRSEHAEPDLYIAGWRSDGRIAIEHGLFSGLTPDDQAGHVDWLRFSGPLWGGASGGPILDGSGRVIGIVKAPPRDAGNNYAVPIAALPDGAMAWAHIHALQMLRSLMPTVSSREPLEAEIPLPMSFEKFSRTLEQLRLAYFDRSIGSLLEATRRNFVLTGDGAPDMCNLLNGKSCACKPMSGSSGVLVVDDPETPELIQRVNTGEEISKKVAGVVLVRTPEGSDGGTQSPDLSNDPLLHLKLAIKGQARPDQPQEAFPTLKSWTRVDQDRLYTDFRDRAWQLRTWQLSDQDLELVSMMRKLPDGYVVLTRTVPTALSYAAALQVKFVANLVYSQCDELPGEGEAQVADTLHR